MAMELKPKILKNDIELGQKGGTWDTMKWNGMEIPTSKATVTLEAGHLPVVNLRLHADSLQADLDRAQLSLVVHQPDGSTLVVDDVNLCRRLTTKAEYTEEIRRLADLRRGAPE